MRTGRRDPGRSGIRSRSLRASFLKHLEPANESFFGAEVSLAYIPRYFRPVRPAAGFRIVAAVLRPSLVRVESASGICRHLLQLSLRRVGLLLRRIARRRLACRAKVGIAIVFIAFRLSRFLA